MRKNKYKVGDKIRMPHNYSNDQNLRTFNGRVGTIVEVEGIIYHVVFDGPPRLHESRPLTTMDDEIECRIETDSLVAAVLNYCQKELS